MCHCRPILAIHPLTRSLHNGIGWQLIFSFHLALTILIWQRFKNIFRKILSNLVNWILIGLLEEQPLLHSAKYENPPPPMTLAYTHPSFIGPFLFAKVLWMRCAKPLMAMSAMIRAHSLNLLAGMELGKQFNAVEYKIFWQMNPKELEFVHKGRMVCFVQMQSNPNMPTISFCPKN